MEIKISVIIPNYNRSAYLKEAIESVLLQTVPVFEILVCDDGSTDDSKSVVLSFQDKRIQWIDCGKNGRPAIPRNIGLKQAAGDWVAFLDNDDIWLKEKLETQITVIKQQKVKAVCCNAKVLRAGQETKAYAIHNEDVLLDFQSLVSSNSIICSSVLIKKDLLQKSGGFPESPQLKALEDYAAWLQASLSAAFYFISTPLLCYRDDSAASIRADSLSTEQQLKRIHDHFRKWYQANKMICSRSNYHLLRNTFVSRFLSPRRAKLYNFLHP